jgi:hypothetical protein
VLTKSSLGVIKLDPYLSPFEDVFKRRFGKAQEWIKKIDETEGGLEKFSKVCFPSRDSSSYAYIALGLTV